MLREPTPSNIALTILYTRMYQYYHQSRVSRYYWLLWGHALIIVAIYVGGWSLGLFSGQHSFLQGLIHLTGVLCVVSGLLTGVVRVKLKQLSLLYLDFRQTLERYTREPDPDQWPSMMRQYYRIIREDPWEEQDTRLMRRARDRVLREEGLARLPE